MKDIFCRIIDGEIPSCKIYEDEDVLAILDISQTTLGHALVLPKKHFESVLDCDEELLKKVFSLARKIALKEVKVFSCNGVNILTNAKEVAGQSVPHFHVHIIPRYDDKDGIKIDFDPEGASSEELNRRASLLKEELDA